MSLRIGIDIGSTTVKVVVLDEENKLLFRSYERHYSKARERAAETLRSIEEKLRGRQVRIAITGRAATPGGAFEMAYLLGREETMKRLDAAMQAL